MKKVLITGGAGFISHHIIAHIIKNTDWQIVTIDRLDISGNLNRLHEILEQFSIDEKKRLKIVFHDLKAEINSAKKLSQDEINKISSELSSSFKSKIKLNYNHDESLIGGLVVQVGSIMIDTSIKNKLQQIENEMIEA